MHLMIIVEPDGDGFHGFCRVLKGLHVGGETQMEALLNALDGAGLYLESVIKHGDPIPTELSVTS
jgi:predicted RNase H-like HicB family nuclease